MTPFQYILKSVEDVLWNEANVLNEHMRSLQPERALRMQAYRNAILATATALKQLNAINGWVNGGGVPELSRTQTTQLREIP